jgi:hypothetical protein
MQKLLTLASALFWMVPMVGSGAAGTAVTTYHYDNLRTGWDLTETVLTTTSVNQQSFQLLHTVQLDAEVYDQVDAQPLFVPSQYIAPNSDSPMGGTYDVVFVATESNNVYAIDASAGVIVNRKSLGLPVPHAVVGGGFNGPNIGIYGTPVIDLETQTLYVIALVYANGTPTYQLHALDLSTFADKGNSPLTVNPPSAPISQVLTDGTTFTFSATAEQQRAGLVLFFERVERRDPLPHFAAIAHLYAGFGSFNDIPPGRGWLLGWTAVNGAGGITLAQLPENLLLNTQPLSTSGGSSIWMSGYGIASAGGYSSAAAAVRGRGGKATRPELFFATGNNLPGPHDGVTNISDSVVRSSGIDASVIGVFAPTNVAYLDGPADLDFSSGGVILLPPQPGNFPDLALAAGKDGNLYLLNRDAMSGSGPNTAAVLNPLSPPASPSAPAQTAQYLGSCFCGPSYFMGSDGINRIVTSQGATSGNQLYPSPQSGPSSLITWKLVPSPSGQPQLVQEGKAKIPTDPTTSFFTVVSSNGTQAGSAIIWAVGTTPINEQTSAVTLYAFNAVASDGTLEQLFPPLPAGTWPSNYHSIAVPVVADGKVFVASNNQLFIFGAAPLPCPRGEGWVENGNGFQCISIPACPPTCRSGCLIDNVPPGPIRFICKIYGKIP